MCVCVCIVWFCYADRNPQNPATTATVNWCGSITTQINLQTQAWIDLHSSLQTHTTQIDLQTHYTLIVNPTPRFPVTSLGALSHAWHKAPSPPLLAQKVFLCLCTLKRERERERERERDVGLILCIMYSILHFKSFCIPRWECSKLSQPTNKFLLSIITISRRDWTLILLIKETKQCDELNNANKIWCF